MVIGIISCPTYRKVIRLSAYNPDMLQLLYDTYRDTLFILEIISDCTSIIQWCSSNFKVCLKWFSHIFNIHVHVFVKVSCEKFIPLIFLQRTEPNMIIQVKSTKLKLPSVLDIQCLKIGSSRIMFLPFSADIDFIENCYWKIARNIENSMKVCFDNVFPSVLSACIIHNNVYWLNNLTFFGSCEN